MNENEFLLNDRITKIQSVINKYGEKYFYIAFSGGRDSVVLSHLIDNALPDNRIPRVYVNTGIEFNAMVSYVESLRENDDRIVIIKPRKNIRETLEKFGYPFKSKLHSEMLSRYQKSGELLSVSNYLGENKKWSSEFSCPKKLKYQFTPEFNIRISDKCCLELKERPIETWSRKMVKPYAITGIMRAEGGRRTTAKCLVFRDSGNLKTFQPLSILDKAWESWYINTYEILLCELYREPFSFPRTGCKGCPFNSHLKHELEMLEEFFPSERKQCEIIWHKIYEEYRRIKYRL